MLKALLQLSGAEVEVLRPVADDADAHRSALAGALDADVVVTSGGVSVGPHDLVRPTLAALGVEEVFWGVAMRPGKPLSFGVRGGTLVFGLPGNPVSSYVSATLFAVPALLALQGASEPGPVYQRGPLAVDLTPRPFRDDFLRATIDARRTPGAARPPGVAHDRRGRRCDRAAPPEGGRGDGCPPGRSSTTFASTCGRAERSARSRARRPGRRRRPSRPERRSRATGSCRMSRATPRTAGRGARGRAGA